MREIKFRAWDKDSKLMLYKKFYDHNWYTTPKNDEDGCHTYSSMQYSDQYHKELMQYTGLKDKNGKEIYEGDIVTADYLVMTSRYKVTIEDGHPQLVHMRNNALRFFLSKDDVEVYEVIGNIYENPELIKES